MSQNKPIGANDRKKLPTKQITPNIGSTLANGCVILMNPKKDPMK